MKKLSFFILIIFFVFPSFAFAEIFNNVNGYVSVSKLRSCSEIQAYDQSLYLSYGLKEYVYNSSFIDKGSPIKGDKFHCVYVNSRAYTGWYSYNCINEKGFDWWGIFNKGLVYKKKCSLGCSKGTGMCTPENPAPLGYTILGDNSKLNGSCANFGPFEPDNAYPKGHDDNFTFEAAPGLNHVFCFNKTQKDISIDDKNTIRIPEGSYFCDSSNNMYYKKCSSGCAYTGFCGSRADGKIDKITYENNPYLFSLNKYASCFDNIDTHKDKYECVEDKNLNTSWLWYCDGRYTYYMNCPKSKCTSSGCKLNAASNGTDSITLDHDYNSAKDNIFTDEIQIMAETKPGIAYIVYDLFIDGKSQIGWKYIFCDADDSCFKKLPLIKDLLGNDGSQIKTHSVIYLFYARSVTGVWSDSEQIKNR